MDDQRPIEQPPYDPPRADDLETDEQPSASAAGASNMIGAG